MTKVIHLKIYSGGSTINLFLDQKKSTTLIDEITSQKKHWLDVTDRSGSTFKLNTTLISGIEIVERRTSITRQQGTIAIKKLAEFAGVHPITITRNFADTLVQSSGRNQKFSRATKKTAIALFEHLSATDSKLKKENFLKLFED